MYKNSQINKLKTVGVGGVLHFQCARPCNRQNKYDFQDHGFCHGRCIIRESFINSLLT